MKKLLPRKCKEQKQTLVSSRVLKVLTVFVLFFAFSSQTSAQLNSCGCLDNGTTPLNGQFLERLVLDSNSPNNWFVVSATNLYDTSSPAPPAAPIPLAANTLFTPISTGTVNRFQLNMLRLTNETFSMVVSNGNETRTILPQHTCSFPIGGVDGDFGVCVGDVERYEIDYPAGQLSNIVWNVNNGAILGSANSNSIFVRWPAGEGIGLVAVTAQAAAYDGQDPSDACTFEFQQQVDIMSEEAIVLACNSKVNITMNGTCELQVTPDMLLEDMKYTNDSYDIVIRDTEADTIVPNTRINMDYLNTLLEVSVVHDCSGNSCWGSILLEDKSIPSLVCQDTVDIDCDQLTDPTVTGFPVPASATVINGGDGVFIAQDFDFCSDVELRYSDLVISTDCSGDFSSTIERKWSGVDINGNRTTCSQIIRVRKATLSGVTFPGSWDDVIGPNPTIDACSDFPTIVNAQGFTVPDPEFTGKPSGFRCMNAEVEFVDRVIPLCNDSEDKYKLIRKWTVHDLCSHETLSGTQTIAVMDNDGPMIAAPAEFSVGTQGLDCASEIEVPAPIVLAEDCTGFTYRVGWKPVEDGNSSFSSFSEEGVSLQSNGLYKIVDLPNGFDTIWLMYFVTDFCGNTAEARTEVEIEDSTQPVPVCDEFTFVGLNVDGNGWAGVESFDDGSWDNCGDVTFEIERMDGSPCGAVDPDKQKIKFCCEDLGNEDIMVQLTVIDKAGNTNNCMVNVTVQDNVGPVLENCPSDRTVNCNTNIDNPAVFGMPTVTDICGADITVDNQESLDGCNQGTLTRIFTATDNSGNTATCRQVITVENTASLNIRWPADHDIVEGCIEEEIKPENLPAGKRFPTFNENRCTEVEVDYEDVVFQIVENACVKILRTWTVIDFCKFNPINAQSGRFTHTQVIKVLSTDGPAIIEGCRDQDVIISDLGNCASNVRITASAEEGCTKAEDLRWHYELDQDNDGVGVIEGNGSEFNRNLDAGTYKITWYVSDRCGNVDECSNIFTIEDTKAPTPYCQSEVITVVMEEDRSATIWASDFNINSTDNCYRDSDLVFSFSSDITETSRVFTCDSLDGEETLFTLRMYVTDPAGNQDFCEVTMNIQDNRNICSETNPDVRISLGGSIKDELDVVIPEVDVTIMATVDEFPKSKIIDDTGEYIFGNLPMYTDYELTPKRLTSYMEGVSTQDLIHMQRHILKINELDSPYKVIAADINGDEKVSAADLSNLRKLILGIYNELPGITSWKFVDATQTFDDIHKPFPINEKMLMSDLDYDYMDANFIAVKVGDVNNTASDFLANINTDNRSKTIAEVETVDRIKKTTTYLSLKDGVAAAGLQLELKFDQNALEVSSITSNDMDLSDQHISIDQRNGIISISWSSIQSVDLSDEFLQIEFAKLGQPIQFPITLINDRIAAEVYETSGSSIEALSLELRNKDENAEFELFQNVPNPFNMNTSISFSLPSAMEATLTIYDVTGKIVYQRLGSYDKGINSVAIDRNEIEGSGILYYQLDTKEHSSSKKMIVIK